jgi:hypothetical protein
MVQATLPMRHLAAAIVRSTFSHTRHRRSQFFAADCIRCRIELLGDGEPVTCPHCTEPRPRWRMTLDNDTDRLICVDCWLLFERATIGLLANNEIDTPDTLSLQTRVRRYLRMQLGLLDALKEEA